AVGAARFVHVLLGAPAAAREHRDTRPEQYCGRRSPPPHDRATISAAIVEFLAAIATRGGAGTDGSDRRRAGLHSGETRAGGIWGHDGPHRADDLVCFAPAVPLRRRARLAVPVRAATV